MTDSFRHCVDDEGHAFPTDDDGRISDTCHKCGYVDAGGPVHLSPPLEQPPPLGKVEEMLPPRDADKGTP